MIRLLSTLLRLALLDAPLAWRIGQHAGRKLGQAINARRTA